MLEQYPRVCAAVDLSAILANMERMRVLSPGAQMMAVIKADGYGHGAAAIGREAEALPYVFGTAVATAEEALSLRRAGLTKPILILGHVFPDAYEELILRDVRLTVFAREAAKQIASCAEKLGKRAKVHVKVDTGMSRIGIFPDEEGLSFLKWLSGLPQIQAEGIFTHFARADEAQKDSARKQLSRFWDFVKEAERLTQTVIPLKHAANSAAILSLPEAHLSLVRAGIALYGLSPSEELPAGKFLLRPALSLKSHLVMVKEAAPGTPVSYGGTHVTGRRTRIATVPVGYGDGYPRSLSNKGFVLLRGRRAPILGRICMDQFMVDVTDIPGAAPGDEVTLIGRDGAEEITVEELSALSGRFPYEFVCDLGPRIPRVYFKNGEAVGAKDILGGERFW